MKIHDIVRHHELGQPHRTKIDAAKLAWTALKSAARLSLIGRYTGLERDLTDDCASSVCQLDGALRLALANKCTAIDMSLD